MNTQDTLIAVVIGATIGFGGSVAFLKPKISSLESELAVRPPVLVVDLAKLAVESVPVGSSSEAMDEHFANTRQLIQKFQQEGYIVLARQSTLGVPESFVLHSKDLPTNKHLQAEGRPDHEQIQN